MVSAVALRQDHAVTSRAAASIRHDVLDRYRHLREIGKQHHTDVLPFVSRDAILHNARRIGLGDGKTLVLDSMDDLTLAFDLAIYTAPTGRSRAIDRYPGLTPCAPGSDEALVLEAMRHARFAIVCVERRHDAAGLIVSDLFRGIELWLLDEGLEISLPDGSLLATRLFTPDSFAMTAGVLVPFEIEMLEDVLCEAPQLGRKTPAALVDDRRFAEAIYRIALADGIMEQVTYLDPSSDG